MGIRIMVVKRKSEKLFLLIFGIKISEPRFNMLLTFFASFLYDLE